MTTFTLANITDILGNTQWSFDASNFLIGQPGVGIVIGEVTPVDETNSVNVSGGYYVSNVNINTVYAPLASPTFTGTVTAPTLDVTTAANLQAGAVVTGKGVELGAPTGGQPATAGQINGTAYLQNNVNIVTGKASHSTSVASPTGTSSTTYVMMGLAGSITPTLTGNVILFSSGTMETNAGSTEAITILSYGTGTAPINGAAVTGTQVGGTLSTSVGSTSIIAPYCAIALVTGLSVGTTYWLDMALRDSSGSATATIASVNIGGFEI